jgi:hypothetical protein
MELLGKLRERIHEFPTIEESGRRFQVAASGHECLDFLQGHSKSRRFLLDDFTLETVFHARLLWSIFRLRAARGIRFADESAQIAKRGAGGFTRI